MKCMKTSSLWFIVLLSGFMILSGCIVWLMLPTRDALPGAPRSDLPVATSTSFTLPTTSTRPAYFFDPTSVHPGDIIAGWTLEVIGPVSGTSASTSSFQNVHAQFSGTATVTGIYDYSMNELFGKETICMTISEPMECAKLPSIHVSCVEPRRFCFVDPVRIKQDFGGVYGSGKVTVQLKSYQVNYASTEVVDTAELIKVLDRF